MGGCTFSSGPIVGDAALWLRWEPASNSCLPCTGPSKKAKGLTQFVSGLSNCGRLSACDDFCH